MFKNEKPFIKSCQTTTDVQKEGIKGKTRRKGESFFHTSTAESGEQKRRIRNKDVYLV